MLSKMLSNLSPMKRIPLPVNHSIEFIPVQDVLYLRADGNYSIVICREKVTKQTTRSLKLLEKQLEPAGFCRIHHEYLVNMDHVTKYHKGDGGEVELSNGEKLAVSRSRKVFLNKWFEL